jgi:hypothetical protein
MWLRLKWLYIKENENANLRGDHENRKGVTPSGFLLFHWSFNVKWAF